jgi:hypothetical protein
MLKSENTVDGGEVRNVENEGHGKYACAGT